MRVRTMGYGLVGLALLLSACGGDSDGSSGGSGAVEIPFEDMLDKVIDLQCGAIESCAGELFGMYLQGMDCRTFFERSFEDADWPNLTKAVEAGRVIYHGDKAQACFDAWAAQGCDLFTSRAPDLCEEALEGTVEAGGSCTHDAECRGPLFCKIESACPGSCTERLAADSPCKADDDCQNGLNCDENLKVCAKPAGPGESCENGAPTCALGLFCAGSEEAAPGTCKEASEILVANEGEPCDLTGTWCKSGLSCVVEGWTTTGAQATCKPFASPGGACGLGIPNQCPSGQSCDANPEGTGKFEGACVPLPANGEPCVALLIPPRCAPYHTCDGSGTCRLLQRLEGACAADNECYSAHCEAAVCAPHDPCANP